MKFLDLGCFRPSQQPGLSSEMGAKVLLVPVAPLLSSVRCSNGGG